MKPLRNLHKNRLGSMQSRPHLESLEDRFLLSTFSAAALPSLLGYTPAATALDSADWLWFAGGKPNDIGYVDAKGHVSQFSAPLDPSGSLSQTVDIAIGPAGNLWFIEDPASSIIGRIDPQGDVTAFAMPSGNQVLNISFGPDGTLWFTEAHGAGYIDATNDVLVEHLYTITDTPQFSIGADGSLLITQGQATHRATRTELLATSLTAASSVAFTADDALAYAVAFGVDGFADTPAGGTAGTLVIRTQPGPDQPVVAVVLPLGRADKDPSGLSDNRHPFPGPGSPTDVVLWISVSEHGILSVQQGPYSMNALPSASGSQQETSSQTPAASDPSVGTVSVSPVSVAPGKGSSSTGHAGSPDDANTPTIVGIRPIGHHGLAEAFVAATISGGTWVLNLATRLTMVANEEELLRLGRYLSAETVLYVVGNLVAASRHGRIQSPILAESASSGERFAHGPARHPAYLAPAAEQSELLAIAREYRHDNRSMVPESDGSFSLSGKWLVRAVALWFAAQSALFGLSPGPRSESVYHA